MLKRICRQTYQQFLNSIQSQPVDLWGREFMCRFFPGIEDPDVTEESDMNRLTSTIEDRYVAEAA